MGNLARFALSTGAAALFAACSGSQLPIGTPSRDAAKSFNHRTRQFVTPVGEQASNAGSGSDFKLSRSLLYVVSFGANSYALGDVEIYDAKANNPNPIAIITKGLDEPNGACIDAAGTLYVASQWGWVTQYAPGRTKPFRYFHKGLSTPADCTIDGNGNLWVADVDIGVVEYLKGSTQPHKIIKNGLTYPNSVVFDHAGNMYVGNLQPYGTSNIQVFPPGSKNPSRTITDGIVWPTGTAVDANNTLYVTNDANTNYQCGNIVEYRAGQSHPFQSITDQINGPTALKFDESGRLFEANEGAFGCTDDGPYSVILEFRHGSVKPSKRAISTRLYPSGLAYYPPQLP
jgi:sugar lactone lactonase YvrE